MALVDRGRRRRSPATQLADDAKGQDHDRKQDDFIGGAKEGATVIRDPRRRSTVAGAPRSGKPGWKPKTANWLRW